MVKRDFFKRILMFSEICKLCSLRAGKDTKKSIREQHKMRSVGKSVKKNTQHEKKKKRKKSKHGEYVPMCCNSEKICSQHGQQDHKVQWQHIFSFNHGFLSPLRTNWKCTFTTQQMLLMLSSIIGCSLNNSSKLQHRV